MLFSVLCTNNINRKNKILRMLQIFKEILTRRCDICNKNKKTEIRCKKDMSQGHS